jgi:hypothetical protein
MRLIFFVSRPQRCDLQLFHFVIAFCGDLSRMGARLKIRMKLPIEIPELVHGEKYLPSALLRVGSFCAAVGQFRAVDR